MARGVNAPASPAASSRPRPPPWPRTSPWRGRGPRRSSPRRPASWAARRSLSSRPPADAAPSPRPGSDRSRAPDEVVSSGRRGSPLSGRAESSATSALLPALEPVGLHVGCACSRGLVTAFTGHCPARSLRSCHWPACSLRTCHRPPVHCAPRLLPCAAPRSTCCARPRTDGRHGRDESLLRASDIADKDRGAAPVPSVAGDASSACGWRANVAVDRPQNVLEGRAWRPSSKYVRRRPTLPRAPARSTIGAEGLNFRVRNGAGCFPFAMVAETLSSCDRRTRHEFVGSRP